MTKTIDTLVEDIQTVLTEGVDNGELFDLAINNFSRDIGLLLKRRLEKNSGNYRRRPDGRGTLRMSNIGQPCSRKLYYGINNPEESAPLGPEVKMKFLFGDIIEELILLLAELSGHKVEGRQDELEIEGIKGHRDAVIDGVSVDVKSASTQSFKKFKFHELNKNDPFGYIDQLQSYMEASKNDPIVTDKTRGAFLVLDKQLGHICLDVHNKSSFPYVDWYQYKKELVDKPEPPAREFEPEADGASGNMKLGVNCSYCDYKKKCWPTLRTFLYSNRPVHLVKVTREPKVPEITENIFDETEKEIA